MINPIRLTIFTTEEYDDLGNILTTRRAFHFRGAKKGEVVKMPRWLAEKMVAWGMVRINKETDK